MLRKNSAVSSSLTQTDVTQLLYMIEEEKMARDVYDALYEQTGLSIFDKISDSEQTHYSTLLKTASKLGVDTGSLSTQAGVFTNDTVQSLYDQLILQGSQSTSNAIEVGILIEETDISDLQIAIDETNVSSLDQVYSNLLNASFNHLWAFEGIA